jgi:hypothetical protein
MYAARLAVLAASLNGWMGCLACVGLSQQPYE